MIQRLALFSASVAAALVIGLGLALAGLAPASSPAPVDAVPVGTVASADPIAAPTVQVDTVYVAAQPQPEVVTVRKTVAAPHGDDEGQGEDD
ncbi:MAG TPA: hypothetical protein VGK16_09145, partial [Candidatus Limnocylindrales bacterium]